MEHPYQEHEGSPLWQALEEGLGELAANHAVVIQALPQYVIGYLSETLSPLQEAVSIGRDYENEETFYDHRATLRVAGSDVDFEEVSRELQLVPTHTHLRGERRLPQAAPYRQDMWSFTPAVPRAQELAVHVEALRTAVLPKLQYLKSLRGRWEIDVFCGYISNSATAGFQVSAQGLRLFRELEIPFSVSVIVV